MLGKYLLIYSWVTNKEIFRGNCSNNDAETIKSINRRFLRQTTNYSGTTTEEKERSQFHWKLQ